MFQEFNDPQDNYYTFTGLPSKWFMEPSPYGNGAILVLKNFYKGTTGISAVHGVGIKLAVAQVIANFGLGNGHLEVYGLADRTGSDAVNKTVSAARAKSVLNSVKANLDLADYQTAYSAGLGERFAAEYGGDKDNTDDGKYRGVAVYFWESYATARDTALQLNVKWAIPPKGHPILGVLNIGRYRSSPPSPFAS